MKLRLPTAAVFEPLLAPSRYKGAWGGRGSGKSHFFAEKLVEDSLAEPGDCGTGLLTICIREVQKDLAQSSKALIEAKLKQHGLGEKDGFKVYRDVIQTPGDGLMIFKGMQDYTAESVKSLEGFKRAWWEEAQTATVHSLNLLRPTIRAPGSELWFSWNARRKTDPVDVMLRGPELPTGAVVVKANWRDNPWFTPELEQERLDCLRMQPDQYDHIWEGGYITLASGAYFAQGMAACRSEGRIGFVPADPLMATRAYFDIGGTGAKADACAIWIVQFVGLEVRVLYYYEAVGQPLAAHVTWLRSKGYGHAQIVLPHDGASNDKVYDVSYESALRGAGFDVRVVKNMGAGAAMIRVESVRRVLPACRFHEATTEGGREALGWYHEKRDAARGIGLGPNHDWSSHGCFHPDTKVVTRSGMCRIMDLPKTGEVMTPCGWKPYIHPRITKRAAPLVEVAFESGYTVKCTPDHLFLTASGWKSAQSLSPDTLIRSCWTDSRSSSKVASTGFGRVTATFQRAAADCIGMLGARLSVLFRTAATFITVTGTQPTTGSATSNALTLRSICGLSVMARPHTGAASSAPTPEKARPHGTVQRLAASGTADRLSGHRAGRNGFASLRSALSAAMSFRHWSAKVVTPKSIAIPHARRLPTGNVACPQNGLLRIASVKPITETADVWDITVPDGHWFSLENGAVVHNSDAFGLMAVDYEQQPQSNTHAPLKYKRIR